MSERDEAAAGKPVAASFRCGQGVVGGVLWAGERVVDRPTYRPTYRPIYWWC